MATDHIRVRMSKAGTELEVEGDPKSVRAWWDELSPAFTAGTKGSSVLLPGRGASRPALAAPESADDQVPDTFGEFFHDYRPDVSNVDKMLIAALYSQITGGSRTFTTRAANELLVEQGVKLSNPSMAVRRLAATKKAFTVSPGVFRISDAGTRYLSGLRIPAE